MKDADSDSPKRRDPQFWARECSSGIPVQQSPALARVGHGFFIGFVLGVIWGRGRLQQWLARAVADKSKGITSLQLRRMSLQQFVVFLRGILYAGSVVVLVVATILWGIFVLSRFEATEPFARALLLGHGGKGTELGEDLLAALPGLMAVVIVFVAARFAHRLIIQFFETIMVSEA